MWGGSGKGGGKSENLWGKAKRGKCEKQRKMTKVGEGNKGGGKQWKSIGERKYQRGKKKNKGKKERDKEEDKKRRGEEKKGERERKKETEKGRGGKEEEKEDKYLVGPWKTPCIHLIDSSSVEWRKHFLLVRECPVFLSATLTLDWTWMT